EEYPDTRKLLFKIARSAKEVLQADLIELYEYRQEEREYKLPPVSVGKKLDPSVVAKDIYKDNTLWQVIHRETPLYEEHPQAKHSDFMAPYTIDRKNLPSQRFVIRENIQSTAVIPLRTGNENRGLMFANYRTPQTFPKAQKELIELFANQAAIALKNAELLEKYIEAQKYLENIIDNSPDPIIVIDKNGNIKIFNKACEQLWGFSTGEVYGKHVTDYYESEAHARELGKKLWMSQHNRIENVEARIKTKDGETVPIRLSASFLFNEKKKRIGSVGVFTDLREMKRLEEQKIQAEQLAALGKLAHTVGHDIKHDIGTVLFYIEPLLRQYDRNNDAKLLRIYTNIKDALWDATDKLQNMLQAGKPKAPRKEAGSITDVLRDIEAQMSRQAAARNVKFQIEYPEKDCLLHLDQGQMREVLAKLFSNSITALEYRKRHDPSFKKGFIMVSARIIKGRLIIVWQDNGIGIAEEDLPKIFNAFFTRQETDSGTGLGLFIVKSIVENHEGEIHVKSVYGKGASFEIALPAMKSGDEMNQAADGS
ncbi:MAG: PAS domain S-box protein, partial [Saprospiraceae bacterium]|nr:PAS domain S-box protein [Saprospiraceae bacterium]